MVRQIRDWIRDRFASEGKPVTNPQAKTGEALWGSALLDPNPDELIQAKGQGVKVYQKMLSEPYVKAGLNNKKFEILAYPWIIVPGSDEDKDIELANELEKNLRHLQGQTFSETLFSILDALDCGYSITEKVWKQEDGFRWGYKKFRSLDTFYYKYGVDSFGEIDAVVAESVAGQPKQEFPPQNYVKMAFMPRYSNPYGSSDLRAAHRAYVIKDTAWKFRAIYIERFGMPPILGRTRPGTTQPVIDELLAIMKQIQSETTIVLPDDMKIEILELAQQTTTEYERAIKDLNKDILVGIMGSFLSTEEGQKTGARNMGEVHKDVMKKASIFIAIQLEDVVNEQIVMPWVTLRQADVENPPKFEFDRSDDFNRVEEIDVLDKFVKLGGKVTLREAHEKFGYELPEDESEPLLEVAIAPSPFGGGGPDEDDENMDKASEDTRLIRLRENFSKRWEPILLDMAAECFQAVRKSNVLADGDILKAKDMKLPINVGRPKIALTDLMFYGNALGRGADIDLRANQDKVLLDAGISPEVFTKCNRRYDDDAHRLAGILKNRLQKAFRHDLLATVAEGGGDDQLWAKFHADIMAQGLDNYRDAVDVEAVSLGYNDGLKVSI